jgi:phospholipid/cholesterol/gamma-HCH transport system ATP-binding protein
MIPAHANAAKAANATNAAKAGRSLFSFPCEPCEGSLSSPDRSATLADASPPSSPASSSPHVSLGRVTVSYGARKVFDSLSCGFGRGKISVILGGSGSGKSTILRLIGGLIQPRSGVVEVDGEDITRLSERGLRKVRRKLGMLFQGGALLDSYTVFDNLALPLREERKFSRSEVADKVHASLESVGLKDVDHLLPGQLSGGMLKRAALARALIRSPVILLCDEPFSGLDPASIKRIESLMVEINRKSGMTMIVVSHHVPSTLRMADRVLLLLGGKSFEGTPMELVRNPDPEIADFLSDGAEEKIKKSW